LLPHVIFEGRDIPYNTETKLWAYTLMKIWNGIITLNN
jgi:hypothetical protein